MIKVDVISGFLGAGKTTLIKKLFEGSLKTEKVALIENEFGEIGIDGGFLQDSGIEIKEINSGCICCSLVGNFESSLKELIETYTLDRIIIEPSGVGKLSEVVSAIKKVDADIKLNVLCTVVDGGKCKMYMKNFGEFFIDQISEANTIVMSKTDKLSEEKIISACEAIKEFNPTATIITTPITELDGRFLLENLEDNISLVDFLINDLKSKPENHEHHHEHHHHHDHEHEHDEHCCCDHEHEHDEHCCCDHEHEHDHDEHCCCDHDHEHHHDHECCGHEHEHHDHECHDPNCCCHHHHHDADEVFDSWGLETPASYTKAEIEKFLQELATDNYGTILRAKGFVKGADSDKWYHFDYVSGDFEIREGSANVIGKLCVIGSGIDKDCIQKLIKK